MLDYRGEYISIFNFCNSLFLQKNLGCEEKSIIFSIFSGFIRQFCRSKSPSRIQLTFSQNFRIQIFFDLKKKFLRARAPKFFFLREKILSICKLNRLLVLVYFGFTQKYFEISPHIAIFERFLREAPNGQK